MIGIGLIEGFFGPEWSWESRHHFCENLRSYGGEFYIYAPKRDPFLRKSWTQRHPTEMWNELKDLSAKCQQKNIAFGLGLSPFEIHSNWNVQTKNLLREKIRSFDELNVKYLGLFFDDMKGSPDLADIQVEIVEYVKSITYKKILFCPTYYSHDPILDKVFGERSPDYLEKISQLPKDIEIFWTGNKVIPKVISAAELEEVTVLLKRKPLIWDNYFANDGPKQCKFLKMKPFEGRDGAALQSSAGWAFNLMNQPRLSELLFASSVRTLKGQNAVDSFQQEIAKAVDSEILTNYRANFVEVGLDGIDVQLKAIITESLKSKGHSQEIRDWLNGKYTVGDECLTD